MSRDEGPSRRRRHLAAPAAQGARAGYGLVARDRELAEIDRVLWAAREGESQVVVLRGEPGIGKSALLSAVVSQAWDFYALELRGRDGPLPESRRIDWPRPLLDLPVDPSQGETASALGTLVAGRSAPVLLAVDDADALSASFLSAVASAVTSGEVRHPMVVIFAVTDLPHCEPMAIEHPGIDTIELRGLTLSQSITLLTRAYGHSGKPGVSRDIVRAAGGNPRALLSAFGALGEDEANGWQPVRHPIDLDDQSVDAFSRCLDGLPPLTRVALGAAAAGRAPLTALEAALGELGIDRRAFDDAAERGIVVVRRSRIDFVHPLVRAAAYLSVGPEDRVRIEAALCSAASAAGMPEIAARHALRSGGLPSRALELFARAARAALAEGDTRAAAECEESMAAVLGRDAAATSHLIRAVSWWMATGEVDRASHCLGRAAAAGPAGSDEGMLAYWNARVAMAVTADEHVAQRILAAAERLDPHGVRDLVLVTSEAALCFLVAGQAESAEAAAERALEVARSSGGSAEALATAVWSSVAILTGSGREAGDRLRSSTAFLVHQLEPMPVSPLFTYVVGLALSERFGAEAAANWSGFVGRMAGAGGNRSQACVSHLLNAIIATHEGALELASAEAALAWSEAVTTGQQFIARRALDRELAAESLLGRHQEAFTTAAKLFAQTRDHEHVLRSRGYRWLAELELQHGRVPLALGWLKAAEFECCQGDAGSGVRYLPSARPSFLVTLVMTLVHDAGIDAVRPLLPDLEVAARTGAVHKAWERAVRALCQEDLDEAEELFQVALSLARSQPVLTARIDFLYGVRLAAEGLDERAGRRFASAAGAMRASGAMRWSLLFEMARERLGSADRDPARAAGRLGPQRESAPDLAVLRGDLSTTRPGATTLPGGASAGAHGEAPRATERLDPAATFEVRLLGGFSVHCDGVPAVMPASLAATALKIVALRRRILAEELVEELWPGAAPGLGMRRLRNVLWRIRATCGDILVRDDSLLLLSPRGTTDVEIFRRLAAQAVDPSTPDDKAAYLAARALELYQGELLPADRYADWSAAARESLSRVRIQLIELCVHQAVDEERNEAALRLLEQLIEADPCEERYYIQSAELQEKSGNRRRALSTLARGERALGEFGIRPSARMQRVIAELA